MNIKSNEYLQMVKKSSPNTKSQKNIPIAFLVGGLICTLGQFLSNIYQSFNIDFQTASTLSSVSLIFISALLTGLNIYNKIANIAGAGTLVPITGFSNSVVSPALEFKTEGLVLGLGTKLFIISGPVISYGIFASIIYGVIYYIFNYI